MDQAHVPAGCSKSTLDGTVVFPGALDSHDEVAESVLNQGLSNACDRRLEVTPAMSQRGRWEMDGAVIIGEHVARARLGAIDADDAKMFGSHGPNPVRENACRFLHKPALG
jgi:hypothetical protein